MEGGRQEENDGEMGRESEGVLCSAGESEARAKGVIADGRPLIAALEKSTCSLMSHGPVR